MGSSTLVDEDRGSSRPARRRLAASMGSSTLVDEDPPLASPARGARRRFNGVVDARRRRPRGHRRLGGSGASFNGVVDARRRRRQLAREARGGRPRLQWGRRRSSTKTRGSDCGRPVDRERASMGSSTLVDEDLIAVRGRLGTAPSLQGGRRRSSTKTPRANGVSVGGVRFNGVVDARRRRRCRPRARRVEGPLQWGRRRSSTKTRDGREPRRRSGFNGVVDARRRRPRGLRLARGWGLQ